MNVDDPEAELARIEAEEARLQAELTKVDEVVGLMR